MPSIFGKTNATIQSATGMPVSVVDNGIVTSDLFYDAMNMGSAFSISLFSSAVGDSSSINILLQTCPIHDHHVYGIAVSGGDSIVRANAEVTLAATSDNGTPLTATNFNQTSTQVTGSKGFTNPTLATTGSLMMEDYVPGGTKKAAIGGQSLNEWILAKNTKHYITFTNISGATKPMQLTINWRAIGGC